MRKRPIIILLFFIASSFYSNGQPRTLNDLVKHLNDYQQNNLLEKVFVHLDRSFYVGGETMWLKIYVMDGYEHLLMDLSKVVYVDILDRNQQPVIQTKISIDQGQGNGALLIPASLESDNYTVRAYTSWMKNFSADFYFHQTISIVNVFQRLHEKNKPSDTKLDIQFFPEGGTLVEGIRNKVAFRIVDVSGKGTSFTGAILNQKHETIASLSPLKFGIGHFFFTPKSSETYQAVINETNGNVTIAELPAIQPNGYSLMVTDTSEHRIKVIVKGKNGNNTSSLIYLIGHTRQIVKVASSQNLVHGEATFLVDKNELGEGVTHLTVFNQSLQPLSERLYFKRPIHTVNAEINSDKIIYEPRSKIILHTNIKSDAAVIAYTSLSVYKNDSLQQIKPIDIQSYLWLTSELKGNIESPEYYFSNDSIVDSAMDNLMLTHGWSRFKWNEVLQPSDKHFSYLLEYRGHSIAGKVIDVNSSTIMPGMPVYLSTPDKRIQPYLMYSNNNGQVLFETSDLVGSKKLIAQIGVSQNASHMMIESPFSEDFTITKTPYLKLSEDLKDALTQRSISMQTEDIFYRGRVINQPQQQDSSAFYGNAPEQYHLDDYTRFPLMEEVIREYVKGVRIRKKNDQVIFKVLNAPENYIFENVPLVLLDGVPVFKWDKIMAIDPLKVKQIDVVTNHYYLGQFTFDGIVSFRTYKNDLGGFLLDPGTMVIDYEGLQAKKEFFSPRYETGTDRQSRLPDLRNLLMWLPDLMINSQPTLIEFYSADEVGTYQVKLQGITQNGLPVFQTHYFDVKASDH